MPEYDSSVIYKEIPGFPGYCAGSDGSIWSCRIRLAAKSKKGGSVAGIGSRWVRKVPQLNPKHGYLMVGLMRDCLQGSYLVHRLILETFVGPAPQGMEACHDPDPNRLNCAISNLRWDTRKSNHADKRKHGTQQVGMRHGMAKLTDEIVLSIVADLDAGIKGCQIAHKYGISRSTVALINVGKTWQHLTNRIRKRPEVLRTRRGLEVRRDG
jgi:hypothetical protein